MHPLSISSERKWQIFHTLKSNKTPRPFYAIYKIHKTSLGSRPITAQHPYLLSGVSTVLADVLSCYVEEEDNIGKDSKTTIAKLEKLLLPSEIVVLTYDEEACYPSIESEDAMRSLKDKVSYLASIGDEVWLKLLKIVMYNNCVTATDKIYLQKIGTATGTQVAPPFASLHLHYIFPNVLNDDSVLF